MKLLLLALLGFVAGSQALNVCRPCETLVGFIETELTRDESEEDKVLDAACAKEVPGPFVKVCDAIVKQGVAIVVHLIDTEEPPAKVCQQCHLCSSSEVEEAETVAVVAPEVEQVHAGAPGQFCAILGQVKAALDPAVLDPDVQKVCDLLKQLKPSLDCDRAEKQADKFIGEAKQIVDFLGKFCPKSQPAEVAELAVPSIGNICPVIKDFQSMLSTPEGQKKLLGMICQVAGMDNPNFNCKAFAKDFKKVVPLLSFAVSFMDSQLCGSSAAVAQELALGGVSGLCPAIKDLESIIQNPANQNKAISAFCNYVKMQAPGINCGQFKAAIKPVIPCVVDALQALAADYCPSSSVVGKSDPLGPLLKCITSVDIKPLCPMIKAVTKIVTNPLSLNAGIKAACSAVNSLGFNFDCSQFTQAIIPYIHDIVYVLEIAEMMCPASAADTVQEAAAVNVEAGIPPQLCEIVGIADTLVNNPKVLNQNLDKYCPYIQPFLPNHMTCAQLEGDVDNYLPVIQKAVDFAEKLCSSSKVAEQEEVAGGQGDVCAYIAEAQQILKNPQALESEIDKACDIIHMVKPDFNCQALKAKLPAALKQAEFFLSILAKICQKKAAEATEEVAAPNPIARVCALVKQAENDLSNPAPEKAAIAKACKVIHLVQPKFDCSTLESEASGAIAKALAALHRFDAVCAKF